LTSGEAQKVETLAFSRDLHEIASLDTGEELFEKVKRILKEAVEQ
jgi:hypothetical protein